MGTPAHRWLQVAWAGRMTVDHRSPEALQAVRRTVGRMLGLPDEDVPLGRDLLAGRDRTAGRRGWRSASTAAGSRRRRRGTRRWP